MDNLYFQSRPDKKLSTASEISKVSNLSAFHIKKLARQGAIPGSNVGGRKWLFDWEDVQKALFKRYNNGATMGNG